MADLRLERPERASLVGSLLVVVAAFLPWSRARPGAAGVDVNAAGIEGNGFLAVVVALAVLATVIVKERDRASTLAALGGGAAVVLIGAYEVVRMGEAVEPGAGLYLALLGAVATVVGGVLGHRSGG